MLVLRGDPGVGKTALLDDVAATAADLAVARLTGIEAEAGLAFAGLHRLLLPFGELAPRLPAPQRAALRVALGVSMGPAPDRYLVGLGVLSLLTQAGQDRPLLVCVDDVQWLDQESLDALAFVARRLHADRVSFAFAARTGVAVAALQGLPELDVAGLQPVAARELLARVAPATTDALVATRIVVATRGVPLAIIDLAQELSERQLVGETALPEPIPPGSHLEAHYVGRLQALAEGARTWLLLAAAEPSGDLGRVTRAGNELGVTPDDTLAAEATGLVSVRGRIEFRHPLVRSAIYGAASGLGLREVHRALASATNEPGDLDRRAWHLAASQVEPDEKIAAELELAADRARDRGGYAARVAFLVRAMELTPEGPQRVDRTLAAAEAAATAGAAVQAMTLMQSLNPDELDPVSRGRFLMIRSAVHVYSGEPGAAADVSALLLDAAKAFEEVAPDLARGALAQAFGQANSAEWMLRGCTVRDIAAAMRRLVGADPEGGPTDMALAGLAALVLDPYDEAVPRMRRAVEALRSGDLTSGELLGLGMLSVPLTTALMDDVARTELLLRGVEAARSTGALYPLDVVLWVLSLTEADIGQLDSAERCLVEVYQLREASGLTPDQQELFKNVEYLAWRGVGDDLAQQIVRSGEAAVSLGHGGAETMARGATSLLAICDGDYETAFRLSSSIHAEGFQQVAIRELPDLIEAAVFTGRRAEAESALSTLSRIALTTNTPWALGVLATARALAGPLDEAEERFREAVRHLEGTRNVAATGRTHLLYGEWLVRNRRRTDARFQLRTALDMFEAMGATRFAARARRELRATGADTTGPGARREHELTPRESTVATMAVDGATNAEIASALLLSPHTIDFHLRKVFHKLQVNSRRDLARALRQPPTK